MSERRCQGCEDAPIGQHTGPCDWMTDPGERDELFGLVEEMRADAKRLRSSEVVAPDGTRDEMKAMMLSVLIGTYATRIETALRTEGVR